MTPRIRLRALLPAFGMACLLVLSASLAEAAPGQSASKGNTLSAVRKTVENSMLVTGSIDIAPDGTVSRYVLDQPEKLPKAVGELVAKVVPALRFEPVRVDGKPAKARAGMGLRVVARQQDGGDYSLRVASANFGDQAGAKGEDVTARDMQPPRYPEAAYRSGISGTVYSVLKIDPSGAVAEVSVEQTNLTVIGNERVMARARELLEKATLATARKWRFDVPTQGPNANQPYWKMRVPVDYRLTDGPGGDGKTPYGKWEAYVPGPKHRIPWLSDEENRKRPDAMVAGTPYPVGSGPKLLTPLQG